jgi:hypothetical protein
LLAPSKCLPLQLIPRGKKDCQAWDQFLEKKGLAGAEAPHFFDHLSARLKSCPDTSCDYDENLQVVRRLKQNAARQPVSARLLPAQANPRHLWYMFTHDTPQIAPHRFRFSFRPNP